MSRTSADGCREHAISDEASVRGLVARPSPADQGHLALVCLLLLVDDDVDALQQPEVGVCGDEGLDGILDDVDGIVDQLLH